MGKRRRRRARSSSSGAEVGDRQKMGSEKLKSLPANSFQAKKDTLSSKVDAKTSDKEKQDVHFSNSILEGLKDEQTLLDKNLSPARGSGLQRVENHIETKRGSKSAKRNRNRKRKWKGQSTSQYTFPTQSSVDKSCPLSSEIQEMELLAKNDDKSSIWERPSIAQTEGNGLSKIVDASSIKKSDLAFETESNSHSVANSTLHTKRVNLGQKNESLGCSKHNLELLHEKVPSPSLEVVQNCNSATDSSLLAHEKMDSVGQGNNSASISSYSSTSAIDKENGALMIIGASNFKKNYMSSEIKSEPLEVKNTYLRRRRTKAKIEGKGVVKEYVSIPSSRAIDSVTCSNRSFTGEVAGSSSGKKNSNSSTFISGHQVPNKKEDSGLQKNAYADSMRLSDISPMMHPHCHEVKNINPEKSKKHKRCSNNNKETSLSRNIMSVCENEESGFMGAENVDSLEKVDLHAEISSNSEKVNNDCIKQYKRAKRGRKSKLSDGLKYGLDAVEEDNLSMPLQNVQREPSSNSLLESLEMDLVKKNIDIDASINNGVLLKSDGADLQREGVISPEIDISKVENAGMGQTIKKKKEKNSNCSDYSVEPVQHARSNLLPDGQDGQKNGSDRAFRSEKNERRTKKGKMKHTEHEETISGDTPIKISRGLSGAYQKASPSCTVLWDSNIEKPPTSSKRESLPPSPIRGVIDDIALPDLVKSQGNLLNTCKEDGSFSFQVVGNISIKKPSENHSENAHARGRDGVDKMIPMNSKDITLNNTCPCDIFPEVLEQNNEDLTELQKCNVFTNEKKQASSDCRDETGNPSSSNNDVAEDITLGKIGKQDKTVVEVSPQGQLISCTRKKLLVLDLNGLLVDVIYEHHCTHKAHIRVSGKSVFKRPFCDEFLMFCFEFFDIGVWSSRRKDNVNAVVNFLMRDMKHKLLFCWDQSKCTVTGFNTIENVHKPLVLKELKKIWDKEEPDLPWQKGDYSPSNTLLIDDSPYKALCNPPHTAIFPRPYHFKDENDNSLGPHGEIRVYLQGLAGAVDVQKYVQENPFGQHAITPADPSWKFYLRIIDKISQSSTPTD